MPRRVGPRGQRGLLKEPGGEGGVVAVRAAEVGRRVGEAYEEEVAVPHRVDELRGDTAEIQPRYSRETAETQPR